MDEKLKSLKIRNEKLQIDRREAALNFRKKKKRRKNRVKCSIDTFIILELESGKPVKFYLDY